MVIIQAPDPRLLVECEAVDKVTPELVATAREMYDCMVEANGVGLSAPQVGLTMRLIVLEDSGYPLIMFNPHIIKRSKETEYAGEGCLSFVGVTRLIKRPIEVIVKYRDQYGKMRHDVLKGLQARAVCHEIEHLSGKLLTDYEDKA